jgi:hypothetical protein
MHEKCHNKAHCFVQLIYNNKKILILIKNIRESKKNVKESKMKVVQNILTSLTIVILSRSSGTSGKIKG